MNAPLNPSQSRGFGAPPGASAGQSRFASLSRWAMTGGVLVGVGLYAAQLVLPYDYKPSVVAGRAAGQTVSGETEAMKEIRLDYERRLADATAQAQAKARADEMAQQKALEARTDSLGGVTAMAGAEDAVCEAMHALSGITSPHGFSNEQTDPWYYWSQRVGAATCGRSEALRQYATRSQLDAVREAAAARGAPMTDGSVPVAPTRPQPATGAPRPAVVNLAAAPHRQFTRDEKDALHAYASRLSADMLQVFVADLDMSQGWPDAWYDRIAYYQSVNRG